MGTIATDKRQVKLYYNSETPNGKKAFAYLNTTQRDFIGIDISKTKVTGTNWVEISKHLNKPLNEFVNQDHPDFKNNYDSTVSLSDTDWIKLLQKKPIILKSPILIDGEDYYMIKTSSDIIKYLSKEEKSFDARSRDSN